ncbi:MAG: hypothetical protein ACK47B_23640 [Armatimonadota bacterium]
MPRIISFAHTTAALVNGFKTVTRRPWKDHYARTFRAGEELLAYDRTPRIGGVPVARIRLTADPVKEPWADAPDADWEGEGFHYLFGRDVREFHLYGSAREAWDLCKSGDAVEWVVRFELLELLPGAAPYRDPRPLDQIPFARLEDAA